VPGSAVSPQHPAPTFGEIPMNLKELKAKGALVAQAPVKKSVTWKAPDGELTFDVHVKRMAFGDWERLFLADDKDKRSRSAQILSECVRLGDKADEPLSYVDAYQLEPSLARVLIEAVNEVNGPKP
jgi:hypothetical protein